jgi:hypothetical protein
MQRTPLIAGAALLALGAGLVLLWRGREGSPAAPVAGIAAALGVEPFAASGAPPAWPAALFADSLVAHLGRAPGLTLRHAGGAFGTDSDFTLRGEVSARDGRLVITASLSRGGERDAFWTATFWRDPTLTIDLVNDLAGAVVEAVYGELARTAVTDKGGRQ